MQIELEKFSIARQRETSLGKETVYCRVEPNGNLFWTVNLATATAWEHAKAELELLAMELKIKANIGLFLVKNKEANYGH